MIAISTVVCYFAYMAIESLLGNQYCERFGLLFTSPSKRYK